MEYPMKKILFFLPLLLALPGCTSVQEKFDLFARPGLETQSEPLSGKFFQPYSEIIAQEKAGWLVRNPQKTMGLQTVLHGLKLDPAGIYELRMRYVGKERTRLFIHGSELKDGKVSKTHVLVNTMSFLNVNGAVEYRKQFAVTPGCEQLIPALSVYSGGKTGNPVELIIEELSITRVGKMNSASDSLKKVNFASDYDFSKHPVGDFNKITKGRGANVKKWSDVKAEIVNLNGEKVLHIVRTPENYIYPYLELAPFTVDPRYYFVKYTFKAKGKGTISPGLWWQRSHLSFDYYHGNAAVLTDDWQTITVIHPCMTPDVARAAVSFTSSGHGEFWIKDISVSFL